MRTTLMAFLLGAILAGGIAYLMFPDRPAPETAAVVQPEPTAEPPQEPSLPAEVPVAGPAQVTPSPAPTRVPAPRAETPVRRARPVEVARNPEPEPASPAVPAKPQPVEPYKPEMPSPPAETASVAVPPVEAEKPAPPEPAQVTIPAGTLLPVRLGQSISSDHETSGDAFTATLTEPLVVDGYVIAERGARAEGRVVDSARGGRVKGVASMSIHLTRFTTADGQRVDIQTDLFEKQAASSTKDDAAKVGAATAIGAAIGAIAGGGKGAAIGAGVGGAAGAGGVLATRGKAVELPVETKISFRLSAPVTITERQ